MAEHYLHKRLSFGLPLVLSIPQLENLLEQYVDLIDSMYCSPPSRPVTAKSYTSRKVIDEQCQNPANVEKFFQAVQIARGMGIKVDLAINGSKLSELDLECVRPIIDRVQPDEMTILYEHRDFFRAHYPDMYYVYSYNSKLPQEAEFADAQFQSFVLGKQYFWNSSLWPVDKEIRFLLNNGCSINCPGCFYRGKRTCADYFQERLKTRSIEQCVAEQCLLPFDIHQFDTMFPGVNAKYKLSTRTDNYEDNMFLLRLLHEDMSIDEIFADGIDMSLSHRVKQLCEIASVFRYVQDHGFDPRQFQAAKEALWHSMKKGDDTYGRGQDPISL